ncbi:sarcosine oxidase subunit alpha family protein [Halovulum sp. GXIMD14794]
MRLEAGGLIDRDAPLSFRFDGREYTGFQGDTLASALLANGVRLMGRSFKYHRPRGVLTSGSDEPNALMEVGSGARRRPNTRATVQELYEGLEARSQNRWPSLAWDAGQVNDLLSPFLGAGFYYKTFMWPAAFWERVYEPIIRHAAGLGRLSGLRDPDPCDKAFAHCDLLVIGAGPAGLMAALMGARAGARVILADEDCRPGGRLLAEQEEVGGVPGHDWAAKLWAGLSQMPNVTLMPRTTVTGAYDGGTFGALERVADHMAQPPEASPRLTFWRIAARRAILASGGLERPVAFPHNDRPGVMLAGAARAYANRWAAAPGARVAVFTNNDDGWRTARDLSAQGVEVAALIDSRTGVEPPEGPWQVMTGMHVTDTRGRLSLSAVQTRDAGGRHRWLEVDTLAVSGGWNPALNLTCHMNGRPQWNPAIHAFVPTPGSVPGLDAAGAALGQFSTRGAMKSGQFRARKALEELGFTPPSIPVPTAEDARPRLSPLWQVPRTKGRAWLDFQNDVTTKDVALAHAENFRSVEHMKRYTTLGMATDQGKTANVGALGVMAELAGREIPQIGTTTFRPPYTPVDIAALGAGAGGPGFAPHRQPPSHAYGQEQRAPTVEAGLWHRVAYYPQQGETHWRQSCDREARMVRQAVGVCDVTTLGKIDVQGPDSAAFLDRVYANTMSTLKPGRVRYGLMLREDGFVMDDGTCARLGSEHFVVTTTTAAAGQVMAHLEFCAQCLWPQMDVALISVTDNWAQYAIAGPKSRELLDGLLDAPLRDFPFMACAEVSVRGVGARLFRISYSGEHAYELAVPARYGDALFRLLVEAAEALGGGPYGMEALNVLRIEKGLLTHAELHGRTTADDLGLGRMVKPGSIGHRMSERSGLSGRWREQLVGLQAVDPAARLNAGARFVAQGAAKVRQTDEGYITSACWSPHLERYIALGFVRNGRARTGEVLDIVDHMRKGAAQAQIVPPPFFDPEGGRLRD